MDSRLAIQTQWLNIWNTFISEIVIKPNVTSVGLNHTIKNDIKTMYVILVWPWMLNNVSLYTALTLLHPTARSHCTAVKRLLIAFEVHRRSCWYYSFPEGNVILSMSIYSLQHSNQYLAQLEQTQINHFVCACTHNLNHKSLKIQISTYSSVKIFPGTLPNSVLQSEEFHKASRAFRIRRSSLSISVYWTCRSGGAGPLQKIAHTPNQTRCNFWIKLIKERKRTFVLVPHPEAIALPPAVSADLRSHYT